MSDVKRYYTCGFDALSTSPSELRQSTALVLATDFDAELALRLEAERRVAELEGDGSWGDMALTVKLAEAERQVGELREQLVSAETRARVNAEDCNEAERQIVAHRRQVQELHALCSERGGKLGTAMGLLRGWSSLDGGAWNVVRHEIDKAELKKDTDDFLNTTSTEGKDHE